MRVERSAEQYGVGHRQEQGQTGTAGQTLIGESGRRTGSWRV